MKRQTLIGLAVLALLSSCSTPSTKATSSPSPVAIEAPSTPEATRESPAAADDNAFVIVAGERVGPITAESTKASLTEYFGADKVREESIYLVEGQTSPGLAIFPDDPPTRVEVVFHHDGEGPAGLVQIAGDGSLWATADGVTVGTDLAYLEQVNGKPFEFRGFGWDMGGQVSDWKGGKLDGLQVTLDADMSSLSEEEAAAVSGDRILTSDNPEVQKAQPQVSKIQVIFPHQQH